MKIAKVLKENWTIILYLSLSIFSILPFFHPGFFPIHDDTQVVRVYEMAQALRDGQFPVRWVGDLGYGFGYPLFNFYAPLPYYVGALPSLFGLDILLATKLMFIVGILISGLFMYLLAQEFFGKSGGILAALFYVYAPYYALDIYVRGAVGEFWAMAFLPLMALGFYKVFTISNTTAVSSKAWKWIVVGAVGYAGVILSHNLTAMMTVPFLIVGLVAYSFWSFRKKKPYPKPYTLYPIFLALGLSAFYWLPSIWEMRFTDVSSQIGGGADFRDHFVCLSQFWNSPWGFGGSAPGCLFDGMSFQIGKLQIILTFVVFLLSLFGWRRERSRSLLILLAIHYLLLAIFMATGYSRPIWEAIAPMAYIQYPWRFLVFATFFISLSAASIVIFFQNRILRLIVISLLLAMLLPYRIKYFQPQQYLNLQTDDYINEENIKWKTSKISDEFLPKNFPKPKNPDEVVKEKIIPLDESVQISNLRIKSSRYNFDFSSQKDTLVLAQVAYFPGWKVFIDGKENPIMVEDGKIAFALPSGQHRAEVIFKNTFIRNFGNALSLISFIILIGGFFYGRRKVKS